MDDLDKHKRELLEMIEGRANGKIVICLNGYPNTSLEREYIRQLKETRMLEEISIRMQMESDSDIERGKQFVPQNSRTEVVQGLRNSWPRPRERKGKR